MPCSNQPCVLLHPPEQGSVNGAIMWVLVQDNDIGGGQQGVSHIIIAGMLDDLHQHNKAWIAAVALDCIHPCMGVMCLRRAQRLLAQHLPAQSSALPLACTPPPARPTHHRHNQALRWGGRLRTVDRVQALRSAEWLVICMARSVKVSKQGWWRTAVAVGANHSQAALRASNAAGPQPQAVNI